MNVSDITYSSLMRYLNKKKKDKVQPFMKFYKDAFDSCYESGEEDFENLCLMEAIKKSDLTQEDLDGSISE